MMMTEDEDSDDDSSSGKLVIKEFVKRKPKKIKIPRRAPSIVIPGREIIINRLPDDDAPYEKPKKLRQCLMMPLTLYELAAAVLDNLNYPDPFEWTTEQVADWMGDEVGLPEYRECILDNHINGRRLLRLEDPSVLPEINIHDFEHIKRITSHIRRVFTTDYVLFKRSVGLPIRKPITHCTWFKSRTGPSWGIRQNWTRSDILRWMKIIMPEPLYLDHWDRVWYQTPDFPKVLFAKIPKPDSYEFIPHYVAPEEYCNEYLTPRRFRLQTNIPEEAQLIWMEHRPGSPSRKEHPKKVKIEIKKAPKPSRLLPKKVNLTGLSGKDLILARRKMPTPKFLKH